MTPANSQQRTDKAADGTIDLALVKAMSHPLRYELLMKLGDRVASPNELSKEVDGTLGTVSYHIRVLEQMGLVELVDTQPRRGATEHFYRATQRAWFSKAGWSRLPVAVRRSIAGATLDTIADSIKTAAKHNAFDDPAVVVTSATLALDEEAYDEVGEILDGALQQVMDIQARALGHGEAKRHTRIVFMHFDRGPVSTND